MNLQISQPSSYRVMKTQATGTILREYAMEALETFQKGHPDQDHVCRLTSPEQVEASELCPQHRVKANLYLGELIFACLPRGNPVSPQ